MTSKPKPTEPDGPALEVVQGWERRKPRSLWMRSRLLILMAAIWGILFWYNLSSDPLISARDGLILTWNAKWWLAVLFGAELVRQAHYIISEHWGAWDYFWGEVFFGGLARRTGRLSNWSRYRARRIFTIVLLLVVAAIIAGAAYQVNPVEGLFEVPGKLFSALPGIVQVLFYLMFGVAQFVLIFWYMSRGGVDVYYPDHIKTRFTDVWGQDAVLERVKECLVFLEDPESIEARGGYVPGGILLWGPPGTGKTLLAEAVAGETGKPFVFVDPGAFVNMFMGVGILKVKRLFRKLRQLAVRYGGVIVFFDEADSLGNRGGLSGGGIFGPGGVRGMTAWPWTAGDCHGGSYLSERTVSLLLEQLQYAAGDLAPGPEQPRRLRDRMMMMGGGGGGGMGTLQSLLSEMSGLKKPRGLFNRYGRKALGMKPKPPPKYRFLIMMATNRPDSLDEALLRPGRIDRIYKVGYPSKAGRVRTYQGYFSKISNELSAADIEKLAMITPYATGASMKDLVNESLIVALRRGREAITWPDVLEAKRLKELGPPEDVEYIDPERHATAVHEACHAVVAYRCKVHLEIDLATIEKGGNYLGMVSYIRPEDRFSEWRSEHETDIMTSLASLAGERFFFAGDSTSGVSGDLESATTFASLMEGFWGMGSSIASHSVARRLGTGGGPGPSDGPDMLRGSLGGRIEAKLAELYERTQGVIEQNRLEILAVAHALEYYKTIDGEDVVAVIEGRRGRSIDGRVYKAERFDEVFGAYHDHHVAAHVGHSKVTVPLPKPYDWAPELVDAPVTGNGFTYSETGAKLEGVMILPEFPESGE